MYILTYHRKTATYYEPIIQGDATHELSCKLTPGKFEFTVVAPQNGETALIDEGDTVQAWETRPGNTKTEKGVFFGFAFSKDYGADGSIKITCYDQLRYLKNKDTLTYENKTADALLKMIVHDRAESLMLGDEIADTKKIISSRVEDNQTYFDMIGNALDLTLAAGGDLYILFDDFGKLALKPIKDLKLPLLYDGTNVGSYGMTSSIDGDTYNAVRLIKGNAGDSEREMYDKRDDDNITAWGLLRYYDTVDDDVDMASRAEMLLERYNSPTKTLQLKNMLGDSRIRAGSLIYVSLDFGDFALPNNTMMVERVKHIYGDNTHLMDITLSGGGYSA